MDLFIHALHDRFLFKFFEYLFINSQLDDDAM